MCGHTHVTYLPSPRTGHDLGGPAVALFALRSLFLVLKLLGFAL